MSLRLFRKSFIFKGRLGISDSGENGKETDSSPSEEQSLYKPANSPSNEDRKNHMKNGWFLFNPPFSKKNSDNSKIVYKNYNEFMLHMNEPSNKPSSDDPYYLRKPGNTGCEPIDEYFKLDICLEQPRIDEDV